MWTYKQSTGQLFDGDGYLVATGYAGKGSCKNSPTAQSVKDFGPLPQGFYTIEAPVNHPVVGKFALPLIPDESNEMYGRMGFFMHGENPAHPGCSSDGCPVLPLAAREQVAQGSPRLQVIA